MKLWVTDIKRHIAMWSTRLGHFDWWPKYVYHFTDVHNAVAILKSGCLFSRNEARRRGLMEVDNASAEIIQRTKLEHLSYARLYFRPRTPTQFRNEGIRPINQRELGGAHCPIPIYFCFDALTVLARDDTEFSNGNVGSASSFHSCERDFFFQIPFDLVFHNGAFLPEQRDKIIFHRNAEVLIPTSLPLEPALKFVACRSTAERQTLLHLLPVDLHQQWMPYIRLGEQGLFERRWTYVEEAVTVDDKLTFRFNPNARASGPFQVSFAYHEADEDSARVWQGEKTALNNLLTLRISNATRGIVTLHLDDALAFAAPITFQEISF